MIDLEIKFEATDKVFEVAQADEQIVDAGVRFKITQEWVDSLKPQERDGSNGKFVTYRIGHSNTSVQLSSELAEQVEDLTELVGQNLYLRASYTADPKAKRVKGYLNWKLSSYRPEKLLDTQEAAIKYAKEHAVTRTEQTNTDPLELLKAAFAK